MSYVYIVLSMTAANGYRMSSPKHKPLVYSANEHTDRSTKSVANDSGHYFFSAVNIKKYQTSELGVAHSNQLNFLEHSEETYNNGL